jgi:dihydropteroate synthase
MGVINLTPDSFSGDGLMKTDNMVQTAIQQAVRFKEEGADILDLGAESTRPGAELVNAETELNRLLPVLQSLLEMNLNVIISIDTYKAQVAQKCLEMGAGMINDVWGLRKDANLAQVVSKFSVPIILMHNRSQSNLVQRSDTLGARYVDTAYIDLMEDITEKLRESITIAKQAGIEDHNIIIDPGIGFGKTVEQNLSIINNLGILKELGYPILLGPSRKSFIGYTLGLPADERLEGTMAAVALGINNGADIIRVHDVKEISRLARMCDAILRSS